MCGFFKLIFISPKLIFKNVLIAFGISNESAMIRSFHDKGRLRG